MDTIFAEGQRRFVECLSSYARQFLGRLDDAAVERIDGLSPGDRHRPEVRRRSPRSTVATATEIYDYLRLLFARLGTPYCPDCQVPLVGLTSSQIVTMVAELGDGTRAYLAAPVARGDSRSCRDPRRAPAGGLHSSAGRQARGAARRSAQRFREAKARRRRRGRPCRRRSRDTGALADSVELALARGRARCVFWSRRLRARHCASHDLTAAADLPELRLRARRGTDPALFQPELPRRRVRRMQGARRHPVDLARPDRRRTPTLATSRARSGWYRPVGCAPSPHAVPASAGAAHGFDLQRPWRDLAVRSTSG